jgi:hypothetical protein
MESLGTKPKLYLRANYGGGAYLDYTFNKRQQALLAKELKNILDTEILYIEEEIKVAR